MKQNEVLGSLYLTDLYNYHLSQSNIEIEKDLVRECLKNNKNAQYELFNTYAKKMVGVCFRYVNDYDIANDLMQEGLIKVFKNLDKFRNDGGLAPWIKRIMINECLNHIRKEKRLSKSSIEDYEHLPSEAYNSLQNLEIDFVLNAIAQLPPMLRTVMNLNAVESYSYPEISELLDIPEGTIRTYIFRARKILTEHFKIKNV